jgi:pimeloyl-ACP methyl ester carboxylesterase
MALDAPDCVKSLILAATGSGAAGRPGSDCVPGVPAWLLEELGSRGFAGYIKHDLTDSGTYLTAEFRHAHPERTKRFENMVMEQQAKQSEYLRLTVARHAFEATHRLGDITAPALVLVGDTHVVGSGHVAQSEVLRRRIPKAEYRSLSGQAHGFFWQAPEETNAVILDWVQSHK